MPGLIKELANTSSGPSTETSREEIIHGGTTQSAMSSALNPSGPELEGRLHIKVNWVIKTLTSFATFLHKAKGDVESASIVLRRACELAPLNGAVLSRYAQFLIRNGDGADVALAENLFQRSLACDPADALTCLGYATLLRKGSRLKEVLA